MHYLSLIRAANGLVTYGIFPAWTSAGNPGIPSLLCKKNEKWSGSKVFSAYICMNHVPEPSHWRSHTSGPKESHSNTPRPKRTFESLRLGDHTPTPAVCNKVRREYVLPRWMCRNFFASFPRWIHYVGAVIYSFQIATRRRPMRGASGTQITLPQHQQSTKE